MPWSTFLTVPGPLVGVVGALLTAHRTDRTHRADVRRECYRSFLAAAQALEAHYERWPTLPKDAETSEPSY